MVLYINISEHFYQQRSYHPGSTASRPISEVKQDRAFSSTQVGDHCETKGGVAFCFLHDDALLLLAACCSALLLLLLQFWCAKCAAAASRAEQQAAKERRRAKSNTTFRFAMVSHLRT